MAAVSVSDAITFAAACGQAGRAIYFRNNRHRLDMVGHVENAELVALVACQRNKARLSIQAPLIRQSRANGDDDASLAQALSELIEPAGIMTARIYWPEDHSTPGAQHINRQNQLFVSMTQSLPVSFSKKQNVMFEAATLDYTGETEQSDLTFRSVDGIDFESLLAHTRIGSLHPEDATADVEEDLDLYRTLSAQRGDAALAGWYIGVDESDNPVGYGIVSWMEWGGVAIGNTRTVASIMDMGVVPEHRGRGYGRLLQRHALTVAKHFGLSHVVSGTAPENAPLIRAFAKNGFTRIGVLEAYEA